LALERQDGLSAAVAALLRGAAGRVTLDEEELGQRRILFLTVRELAGQPRDVERALAARHLARLARRLARPRRLDDLAYDDLRLGRMLEEERLELLRDDRFDDALDLGGNELVLRLRRELRVGKLHRQHRGQPFARIVARGHDLLALRDTLVLDVLVQRPRHRGAEALKVRAAVALRDIVRVAEHGLLIAVVPLQRGLDLDIPAFFLEIQDRRVQRRLAAVQVRDEGADTAFELENVAAAVPLVLQRDPDAAIQERQLPQPLRERVVVELEVREDLGARLERDRRPGAVRRADLGERRKRLAVRVFLLVDLAAAVARQGQRFGERVDDGHADAGRASGDLVRVVVEFAARVQDGHDDLGRRAPLLGVDIDRDAAAVVGHGDGLVGVDRDVDLRAEPRQSLVDRVVDDLEHHVMETGAIIGVTDIHSRPLPDGLKALSDLDILGRIFALAHGVAILALNRRIIAFAHSPPPRTLPCSTWNIGNRGSTGSRSGDRPVMSSCDGSASTSFSNRSRAPR